MDQELLGYRLDLAYIGTPFHGFQSQVTGQAVQDYLERALKTLLKHPVRVRGASRTDTGVHAEMQVATFFTHKPFSKQWILGLNALTPRELAIKKITPLHEPFDPIRRAKAKAYRYRLWQGKCFNPFLAPFVWEVYPPIDADLLASSAQALVGRHDFAAFCNRDSDARTTVRRILQIKVEQRGPVVDIWFLGEGFLKQMVRIMVGTLVAIARGRMPPDCLPTLLLGNQRRAAAGMTAPAQGLSLVEIFYEEVPDLKELIVKAEQGYCLAVF